MTACDPYGPSSLASGRPLQPHTSRFPIDLRGSRLPRISSVAYDATTKHRRYITKSSATTPMDPVSWMWKSEVPSPLTSPAMVVMVPLET